MANSLEHPQPADTNKLSASATSTLKDALAAPDIVARFATDFTAPPSADCMAALKKSMRILIALGQHQEINALGTRLLEVIQNPEKVENIDAWRQTIRCVESMLGDAINASNNPKIKAKLESWTLEFEPPLAAQPPPRATASVRRL